MIISLAKLDKFDPLSSSRKPYKIDLKMVIIDWEESSGIQTMLKCLNNLGVTGFLPPIGGAQAVMNDTS
jgi:hypothetical protein